ncbi:hypothetical protein RAL05_004263 [Vibrio vulnificus]|nr:hypothetical protein [Vibrio vulnificus]
MSPKSHTLFHFTDKIETLKLILMNGFWPRFCLEDVSWLKYPDFDFIAYPMVCFCDIPLSRVNEHVSFYGEYGLGLTKDWAVRNGITPVQYISNKSNIPKAYRDLSDIVSSHPTAQDHGFKVIRQMLAHAKPISGQMNINEQMVERDFVQESEWRLIADNENYPDYLNKTDFENADKRNQLNELTKAHSMCKIVPNDIKYIFVKRDTDIPTVVNFIQEYLGGYSGDAIKLLVSRVISLETIQRDI